MRMINRWLCLLVLAGCVAGCRSGPPLQVTSVQLGRQLNPDGTVGSFTATFTPAETVYVSVLTAGVGDATLSVRWMYAGRSLGEPQKQLSVKDVAATEFHLQSATGFPPGQYTVEVFMNGQPVETRKFTVAAR